MRGLRDRLGTWIPHGAAKRWSYGGSLLLCGVIAWRYGWFLIVPMLIAVAAVRGFDLRYSARRRIRLGRVRGYFFEGRDSSS